MYSDLISLLLIVLTGAGVAYYLDRKYGIAIKETDYSSMSKEIERLRIEVDRLNAELAEERKEREEERDRDRREREALYRQIFQYSQRINTLELKESEQRRLNAELQKKIANTETKSVTVLGVWSGENLDVIAERNAIYNAGFEYVPLFGNDANQENILKELRKGKVTIIEIGAHGDANAIFLGEKELTAGWWERVLRNRGVRTAVILACFSDSSVADAMLRSGVKDVIAVRGQISDEAAIKFAEQFYQLYADGMAVEQAYNEALLALDLDQAEKLVLRQ